MRSTLTVLSNVQNTLLSRRQIRCVFKGGNGFITRSGAAEALASEFGAEKDNVQIISMRGRSGDRDLVCDAYVFDNVESRKLENRARKREPMLKRVNRPNRNHQLRRTADSIQNLFPSDKDLHRAR
jgi:ribosomal protein S24E